MSKKSKKPGPRNSDRLQWYAIDFDGTLCEAWKPGDKHDHIGAPIEANIGKLCEVVLAGYKVIIHTSRPWADYELIEWWLNENAVPFSRIVCGKLMAKYYIDDRNGPSIDAPTWVPMTGMRADYVIYDEVSEFAGKYFDDKLTPWQRDMLNKTYTAAMPKQLCFNEWIAPTERPRPMSNNADFPAPDFTIKDSGERQAYASGMVRDVQDDKPDYTLLPLEFLDRWAAHMTKGAAKYGRENWRLASSQDELQRFRSSAFRHFMQWLRGDRDEDHASAVCFNVAACEATREKIEAQS